MIYCVQSLLPEFTHSFDISPATASLALSVTTGSLALAILLSGALALSVGRRALIFVSIILAAFCNLATVLAWDWHLFLLARAGEGFLLGGVPAIAMVYLAEEIDPRDLGRATGLYVAGTAGGAMLGRLGMGAVADFASWRLAMALLGVICMGAAICFLCLIPPSRRFTPRRGAGIAQHAKVWAGLLRDQEMLKLYVAGFALTCIFVTVFSYSTFRLSEPPFRLSPFLTSLIFLTYGLGMVSSSTGGQMIDRWGHRNMLIVSFALMALGIAITLSDNLVAVVLGISIVTIGFFTGHSCTSSAVAVRSAELRSHSTALYLVFYYLGASVIGTAGGAVWEVAGWLGIVLLGTAFCAMGVFVASVSAR